MKTLLIAVLVFNVSTLSAQFTGGIGGGYTKFVGEDSETVKSGIALDGAIFYKLRPNYHFGSRIAYHRWAPNKDVIGAGLPNISSAGNLSSVEIVPTIRITTSRPKLTNFFAQWGGGYFRIKVDTRFVTVLDGITYTLTIDETRENFGLTFGGGLMLVQPKTRTLFYPQLTLIFEENVTKYFSLNVGIHFH